MIYLVFRELTTRDGASIQFVIGKGTADPERAKQLATLMNENKRFQESSKLIDCKVRHYVMEVDVEGKVCPWCGDVDDGPCACRGATPVLRGNLDEPLGGQAGGGGSRFMYLICGNCTPDPLHEDSLVFYKARKIGLNVTVRSGTMIGVDVLECPKCGHQVLR